MQSQYRAWCTHSQPKSCRVGLSRVANQESLHLGFQKHPCSFELGTFAKNCVLKVIGKHKARWCIRAEGTRSACYQSRAQKTCDFPSKSSMARHENLRLWTAALTHCASNLRDSFGQLHCIKGRRPFFQVTRVWRPPKMIPLTVCTTYWLVQRV